jgi:parallel beta-helix repeat protein
MSNRYRLSLGIGALSVVTSVALGLLVLTAVPAAAGVVSCPALITACGCTITDANIHSLANDISAADGLTGKGDCIDIKHRNATLDGTGSFFSATGAGTGVGIRILSGATRATVQNFDEVTGWDIGIEDDAGSANINFFNADSNGTAGVFLNSVNKTVVDDFDADDNTGACIILKNSNTNTIHDFAADDCGDVGIAVTGSNRNSFSAFDADDNFNDGVDLKNSSKNSMSDCTIDDNGGNGVTFKNSNKNSLSGFDISDNGGDGVFIDPSSQVKVADGTADDNLLNGIEIDRGSKFDSVTFNCAVANGGTDLLDDNAACSNGKNVWSNNGFDTASPSSCIPLTTAFTCE